jgi:hypothetical protein
MLILKKSYLVILLSSVSLFIGCAKDNHLKELKKLKPVPEKDTVTVGAHLLTKKESQRFFGTSFKNYQPIQLRIINGTQQCYIFNPRLIDLPFVDIKKVAKEISRSIRIKKFIPIILAIGIGIPLLGIMAFGWLGAILAAGSSYGMISGAWAAGALGCETLLISGTTLACIKIDDVAFQTEIEISEKSPSHRLSIRPEEEVNVFFFVEKKELKNNFSLQLTDEKCLDTLELNVRLEQE